MRHGDMTHTCCSVTCFVAYLQQQLPAEVPQLLAPPNRQHRRRRHVCRAALCRCQQPFDVGSSLTKHSIGVIGCQ